MINWKNTAENLILIIITFVVGAAIGYYASILTAEKMIEQMTPTIREAILKETTKIENKIDMKIDKIKKSDSIQVNINQEPISKIKQKEVEKVKDTLIEEKKTWLGRLFSKKK